MACPSKKSMTIVCVKGLNRKACKEAGILNTVANCVSDGNAARGSSVSVMEVTKVIEQSRKHRTSLP
jgi:hypothetical protein